MNFSVYLAFHENKEEVPYEYIVPIQVGACKNKEKLSDITDSDGDNISIKNDKYSELTALYWIWKNVKEDYIGLCHYRRIFIISKEKAIALLKNKIEVIVPKKMSFTKSLTKQYKGCHDFEEWNIMKDTVKELYPSYYNTSLQVFSNNKLFPYNMFIASRNWLNNYSSWLFRILSAIESNVPTLNKDIYQKRYIGFLGERLMTLYLIHNGFSVFECDILEINRNRKTKYTKLNLIKDFCFQIKKYFIGGRR